MISKDSVWADMRTVKGRKDFAAACVKALEKGAGSAALTSIAPGTWDHSLQVRAAIRGDEETANLYVSIGRDNVPYCWFAASAELHGVTALHGGSQGMNRSKGSLAPVWEHANEPLRFLDSLGQLGAAMADGSIYVSA